MFFRERTVGAAIVARTLPAALAAGLLAVISCVNPKDRYDEFIDYTADARGVSPKHDAGEIDAQAPAGSFEGAYVMVCKPHITTSPEKALKFRAHVKFTANASGGGGQIEMAITALQKFTDDFSATAQDAYPTLTATVGGDAHFDANIGNIIINTAANSIAPNDAHLDNTVFRGILLSPEKFCAGLDAFVRELSISLDPADDICLITKEPSDTTAGPGTIPTYTTDDFHCP